MYTKKEKTLSSKLPFDQFSRQKIVSYLIEESFRKNNKEKTFNIIDLGGYKGKTAEFQPKDKVTVLDVFDSKTKNYIKGDASNMEFDDNSYDIACSFDVFEHIPREKRKSFIEESLRVSKIGVFLAIPIDINNQISSAEILMNDFYVGLTGVDHKWLREHIDYKIPSDFEMEKIIKQSGASMVYVASNQIGDWELMQSLLFISSAIPDVVGEVNDINTWYNKNTLDLDSVADVGYRRIIFLSKNKKNVDRVKKSISKLRVKTKGNSLMTVNKKTFSEFSKTLSLISKKYYQLSEDYRINVNKPKKELIKEVNDLKQAIKKEKRNNQILKREINDIHRSKSWKFINKTRAIKDFIKKPFSGFGSNHEK